MKKFSTFYNESIMSTYKTFVFASQLAKKFIDWDAYKLGLIDDKGNLIKKPITKNEKKALTSYDNLIRKIKKLLHKFTPDNEAFNTLVSLYLIKQESTELNNLRKEFENQFTKKEIDLITFYLAKEKSRLYS